RVSLKLKFNPGFRKTDTTSKSSNSNEYIKSGYPIISNTDTTTNLRKSMKYMSFYISRHGLTNTDLHRFYLKSVSTKQLIFGTVPEKHNYSAAFQPIEG
ncbi:MAG: hypothetical protein KAR85_08330, partial [Methanosarcinales archaeon]|nr:hypothetical protein [Methanosarcinales archaeon]